MSKFLYGAAVQGIQGFIFQTNKLREIVGASELVEEICTTLFASIVYDKTDIKYEDAKKELKNDKKAILFAAGNIKYIFDTKEECERIVKVFPKMVSEFAPGISASQAVVEMEGVLSEFKDAVNELESRLRTQRNKQMRSQTLGLMGILRSRQSGLPVVEIKKDVEHWDAAKKAKLVRAGYNNEKEKVEEEKETTHTLCKKAFGMKSIYGGNVAHDIEDITKDNDWIAIIHADGNGLGQIVQKIGTDKDTFRTFSQDLDKATTEAAVEAYKAVKDKFGNSDKKKNFIPIRPIVLGGDDLTVVCRGDLALDYVTEFIKAFESKTKEYLGKTIEDNKIFTEGNIRNRLTACAGIAYVKSSYPFYYGYELAESLCSRAKKYAKNDDDIKDGKKLPLSCLMFHKVQSSFVEEYDEIVKKELTPQEGVSFEFGPYFINDKKNDNDWTVDELLGKVEKLDSKEGNAVKSHLRNWLTLLHDNEDMAKQKLERLKSMTDMKDYVENVTKDITRDGKNIYPVYDILAIHTINTQKTKGNE